MAPCGLAGHRQCTISVSSLTLHLRVVNFFFSIESFYRMFLDYFYYNLYLFIYLFFNIIIICLSIFVLEFFIMPNMTLLRHLLVAASGDRNETITTTFSIVRQMTPRRD